MERNFFNARKNQDYKSFKQVPNITASDDDRIIYFTMVDSYQRLKPIYEQIKTLPHAKPTLYRDNYSDLYFLEVFSSDATKANGVLKIKKMLHADKVVAFGDNLNDIDMLGIADIGVLRIPTLQLDVLQERLESKKLCSRTILEDRKSVV